MESRFIELSWMIPKYKFAYYCGDIVSSKHTKELCIPDAEYDTLENEYRKLAKSLNKPPYSAEMVGFDQTRPSCKLVMRKYGK